MINPVYRMSRILGDLQQHNRMLDAVQHGVRIVLDASIRLVVGRQRWMIDVVVERHAVAGLGAAIRFGAAAVAVRCGCARRRRRRLVRLLLFLLQLGDSLLHFRRLVDHQLQIGVRFADPFVQRVQIVGPFGRLAVRSVRAAVRVGDATNAAGMPQDCVLEAAHPFLAFVGVDGLSYNETLL